VALPAHQSTTSLVIPNGATSGNLAYPAGIAAGDLLLLVTARSNTALGTFSVPAGFTQTGTDQVGTSPSFAIWYKLANGTESGSVAVGHDSSTSVKTFWLHRFTSVSGATPIHVAPTTSGAATGSGTVTMRSVTTTGSSCLALHVEVGNTQSGPMSGSESGESGGDWIVRYNAQPTGGQPHVLHTADMASAGTISGGSFALTITNQNWRASGMALQGEAAGSASASAGISFSSAATLTGIANASGDATTALAATGALRGIAGIGGGVPVALGLTGHLENRPHVADIAAPPTMLGGGWDARRFRRLLEDRRRALQARIQSLSPQDDAPAHAVDAGTRAEAERLAERVTAFAIAPPRQAWRLREQAEALGVLERRLVRLTNAIAIEIREREVEELVLLAA
jgi:hypothetical protein